MGTLRKKSRSHFKYFYNGDRVFYKQKDSHKWEGPGYLTGQDSKVILVRHGSSYARVSHFKDRWRIRQNYIEF